MIFQKTKINNEMCGKSQNLIKSIERILTNNFDIKNDFEYDGIKFELFAESHVRNIQNFLTNKDIVESFDNNEYIFVKLFAGSKDELKSLIEKLLSAEKKLVKPGPNHMFSFITLILILADSTDKDEIEKYVKSFKFSKVYRLYLYGWFEFRIAVINIENGELTLNPAAKPLKKFFKSLSL
ncbi:MAG: hypothetical protein ACK4MM_04110 [Fervidobacterium sp.]